MSTSVDTSTGTYGFADIDKKIVARWKESGLIDQLLESKGPLFRFMDGPPFVSSNSLHYGHILISILKSTVLYYKSMTGNTIVNKMGYDCHGLPTEQQIAPKFDYPTNKQIRDEIGVDVFNEACKEMIKQYSGEWDPIFNRCGRMTTPDDIYMTMDPEFMESVWWGVKQVWDKDMMYRGYRVLPYATCCETPLSTSEAGACHKVRQDPSVFVKLKLKDDSDRSLIIWTTTPWTLVSNQAVCVHPTHTYVDITDLESKETWIVAEKALPNLYPKTKKKSKAPFKILKSYPGSELANIHYVPVFSFVDKAVDASKMYRVIADPMVSITDVDSKKSIGTGIVHIAPGFGEDDFWLCTRNGIVSTKGEGIFCPINETGHFTDQVGEFSEMLWEDANKPIIQNLKANGHLVRMSNYTHNYPYCWRHDSVPLIYRVADSFFVKTSTIQERMVEHNENIRWTPEYIGKSRFKNWVAEARDWSISRNRFFGTPIPIWTDDDGDEMICVGSIDELVELGGLTERPADLHKEFMDKVTIRSPETGKLLHRVPDVLDCWFESGSVPFAQYHYPFENPTRFDGVTHLSDFICEGIDQTRGWFYTLTALSTIIFDVPAFANCVCTGLILASDGKKMSKRLKNYPDPFLIMDKYGTDALRLYLINSPVTHGDCLKFSEKGVKKTLSDLIHWNEGFNFLAENLKMFKLTFDRDIDPTKYVDSTDVFDQWIMSRIGHLVKLVNKEMNSYKFYTILPSLVNFIEELTNWYIKFNRDRMKRVNGETEAEVSLATLTHVNLAFCKIMAPFAPLFTDHLYDTLKVYDANPKESVLLCEYPDPDDFSFDEKLNEHFSLFQTITLGIRQVRLRHSSFTSRKMPLIKVIARHNDNDVRKQMKLFSQYIKSETNVFELEFASIGKLMNYELDLNNKVLGTRFRGKRKAVVTEIMKLSPDEYMTLLDSDSLMVIVDDEPIILTSEEVSIVPKVEDAGSGWDRYVNDGIVVDINLGITDWSLEVFRVNKLVRIVQDMRKSAGLKPWDSIEVVANCPKDTLTAEGWALLKERIGVDVQLGTVATETFEASDWTIIKKDVKETPRDTHVVVKDSVS